jgi:glutathione S-transferase
MGQSSNVYAVAMMGDGKVLYAQKEVKVTLGGCGGSARTRLSPLRTVPCLAKRTGL